MATETQTKEVATATDPRFDYERYEKTQFLKLEEINGLAKIVLGSGTGTFGLVVASIKVLALFGLAWMRKEILAEHAMIDRQKYELKRSKQNLDDIDQDSLDGK